MRTNPFRVLLVSPSPTYEQKMSLIGDSHAGAFPLQSNPQQTGGRIARTCCSISNEDNLIKKKENIEEEYSNV